MIEITIEEYTKIIGDLKSFEIGFTITISLLAVVLSSLLVCLLLSLVEKYQDKK